MKAICMLRGMVQVSKRKKPVYQAAQEKLATEFSGGISAYKVEVLPAQLWWNECRIKSSPDRAVRPKFSCVNQIL